MTSEKTLSFTEKKEFICNNTSKLERNDLLDLGKTIIRHGYGESLKPGADGSRMNLDRLPGSESDPKATDLINTLYSQVKHKIEK